VRRTDGAAGAGGVSGAAFSAAVRAPRVMLTTLVPRSDRAAVSSAASAAACGPTAGSLTPALSGLVDRSSTSTSGWPSSVASTFSTGPAFAGSDFPDACFGEASAFCPSDFWPSAFGFSAVPSALLPLAGGCV
jgi:hypothetical protein